MWNNSDSDFVNFWKVIAKQFQLKIHNIDVGELDENWRDVWGLYWNNLALTLA
jgi:hypothetical protein